jgi:hypothetical protein
MRALRVALLLFLTAPAPATAQLAKSAGITAGTRIRVETAAPKSTLVGIFLSESVDSLSVAVGRSGNTVVSSASVNRLSVTQGKSHGRGAVKGIKIGSMIGGALALALFGGAFLTDPSTDGLPMLAGYVAGGMISGAVYGAIIGGAIGTDSWRTVYPAPNPGAP